MSKEILSDEESSLDSMDSRDTIFEAIFEAYSRIKFGATVGFDVVVCWNSDAIFSVISTTGVGTGIGIGTGIGTVTMDERDEEEDSDADLDEVEENECEASPSDSVSAKR